jgi:hypothetical protein
MRQRLKQYIDDQFDACAFYGRKCWRGPEQAQAYRPEAL